MQSLPFTVLWGRAVRSRDADKMPPGGTYRSGVMVIISAVRTEYTYAFVSVKPSGARKKYMDAWWKKYIGTGIG